MRGGGGNRSFSSRGGRDRDYGGGKFRSGTNSYRDGPSSGGRFNNNQGRRFDDNNRNRSRYDRRSPDRFHGHNDRSSRVNDLIKIDRFCFFFDKRKQINSTKM